VIFNNPVRRNAVSLEMWEATARILDDFGKDDDVRVVVLTGAGDKAFVSGADISRFENERANEEAIARYNRTVERANAGDLRLSEADHCNDPGLLHRRRRRARAVLRPAHLLG